MLVLFDLGDVNDCGVLLISHMVFGVVLISLVFVDFERLFGFMRCVLHIRGFINDN